MNRNVFPSAVLNQTVEVYDSKITPRSQAVYQLLTVMIILALLALPLVKVDVAVMARGTFQSSLQRNPLISSVGGRLEKWAMAENQKVVKGDLIAVIRSETVQREITGLEEQLKLVEDFISDLGNLLPADISGTAVFPILKSKFYQASYLEFQSRIYNQAAILQKLERDYDRAKILFESKSIAFAEFDNTEVQYKQAYNQLELLKKQQLNHWEQELVKHQNDQVRLKIQMDLLIEQMDQYRIIAGANGTLQNVLNLNEGDFVLPQQKLGELSPDTTLIAVTYISPMDIAFIEKGQEVTFQIDSYNYNQWGVATGKVIEIADDLSLINEKQVGFLVTCALDTPYLSLSSGQEGMVKKGMTYNARFVIARRSLFQLLYDKVDNWINPQVQLPS